MARLLVGLVVYGAALVAAESGACVGPKGDACGAVDHSLVQIASRGAVRPAAAKHKGRSHLKHKGGGSRKEKHAAQRGGPPARLAEIEVERGAQMGSRTVDVSIAGAASAEENRTIANITGAIDKELTDLELMSALLQFGQEKLCGSQTQDGARVRTLEAVVGVESLLQETAVEVGEGGASSKSSKEIPTEADAETRTLENVTDEVQERVRGVESTMGFIDKQKDKNEVVAKKSVERIKTLIDMLTMETQECRGEGMYGQPAAPLVGSSSVMAQSAQQASNPPPTAAHSLQHAANPPPTMARSGQQAFNPAATMAQSKQQAANPLATMAQSGQKTADSQSTMAQPRQQAANPLATMAQSGQKTADSQPTMAQPRQQAGTPPPIIIDLSQPGQQAANPPPTMSGQEAMGQAEHEIKRAERLMNMPENQAEDIVAEQEVDADQRMSTMSPEQEVDAEDIDPNEPLALLAERTVTFRHQMPFPPQLEKGMNLTLNNVSEFMNTDLAGLEKDVAALVRQKNNLGVADAKGAEKLTNMDQDYFDPNILVLEQQAKQGTHGNEKVRGKVKVKTQAKPPMVAIINTTIANVSEGIDAYIASLEKDLDTITLEKHQICMASSKFLVRMQSIVSVLSQVEC